MNYLDLILVALLVFGGAAAFVLVYWLAKRANAKENGEAPPSFTQAMRGLYTTQGGGGPRPKDPN